MVANYTHQSQVHSEFSFVLDPASYEPLPDDWLIGVTDVVNSTAAIRAGRYEDVNYAGASIIAALGNAWGTFDFPFVFRGDGAAFALPPNGHHDGDFGIATGRGLCKNRPSSCSTNGAGVCRRNTRQRARRENCAIRGVGKCHLRNVCRGRAQMGGAADQEGAVFGKARQIHDEAGLNRTYV